VPQSERVQPPSPTNGTNILPASDSDVTNPAPEAPGLPSGPTPPPQPRSWFASLSRRGSSNVPLHELAQKSPTSLPSEQPASPQPAHLTTAVTVPAMPPPDERPDPAPISLSVSDPQTVNAGQPEAEVKLIPRKRAWFAPSLSSKPTSKLRTADEPSPPMDSAREDRPVPEISQPPVTNIIPPTPPKPELAKFEGEPSSETIPAPIPAARKWFFPASSSQAISPETEARAVPPSQAGVKPSSLDDQEPNLASASAASAVLPKVPSSESSPPVMLLADPSQNLSSLSPSASRFSLSIPFLGRPKVPLDRAIASVHASDTQSEPDTSQAPSKDLPAVERGESAPETPEATGKLLKPMITCKPSFCSREFPSGPCATFRAEHRAGR
jgi:hypothetical protein